MSAVEVVVTPARGVVHLGQDASFSCSARNVPAGDVQFHWQVPAKLLNSGRVEDNDDILRIVNTAAADNNTDISCIVLGMGNQLQGTGMAELVVLPALPTMEPSTTTPPPEVTSKVGSTVKLITKTEKPTVPSTVKATTRRQTTSLPSTSSLLSTSIHTTPIPSTAQKTASLTGTALPSQVPNDPQIGPTMDGLGVGIIAPAVVGGLVLLVSLLVTGIFLMRRHRQRSKDADAEKAAAGHAETQMYEIIPPGSLDFQDGGNSDEENHNLKRHGNNFINQDSLRTYSRGTAPDSITRYAKAVPRKDRIVNAGGHGGKPRRSPVLTLSMNSLYEETTPTFVVANPENGQVDVKPYKAKGEAVEIVGSLQETGLEQNEDEDHYVTLAQNPPQPQDSDRNEQDKPFQLK